MSNTLEQNNINIFIDESGQPYFNFCEVIVNGLVDSTTIDVYDNSTNTKITTLSNSSSSVLLIQGIYKLVPIGANGYVFKYWESFPNYCTRNADNSLIIDTRNIDFSSLSSNNVNITASFSNIPDQQPTTMRSVSFYGVSNCIVKVYNNNAYSISEEIVYELTSDSTISVPNGTTISFTIEPSENYNVTSVKANNSPLSASEGKYELTINSDTTIQIELEETQQPVIVETCSLTINGFKDNNWKVTVISKIEEEINIYEFISNNTVNGIRKGSKITFEVSNQSNSHYYYKGGLTDIESLDSNETLECIFEKIQISINSLEHWQINNLSGGEITNTTISNIYFNSTVSFDIVPDENYTFNKCTITRYGITTPLNTQHVVIENIKEQCSLSVSLIKDHVTPDVVVSGEAEQKHYRFKVKYKNSDSEIWIDWYANVFNYITNE